MPRHPRSGRTGLIVWILDARGPRPAARRLRRAHRRTCDLHWQSHSPRSAPARDDPLHRRWATARRLAARLAAAARFLLHAYGGSAELARDFAALGAYFSFSGYFLGERQAARRAVFQTLPADRLLVETDAPAMPLPAERRLYSLPGHADGNPINHPANIAAVYAGLAKSAASGGRARQAHRPDTSGVRRAAR